MIVMLIYVVQLQPFIYLTPSAVDEAYFSFLLHPHIPDFQMYLYIDQILSYPNNTIHQWKSYFFQLADDAYNSIKKTLLTGFVVQDHKYEFKLQTVNCINELLLK